MGRIPSILFSAFLIAGMVSCDSARVYETNQDFTEKVWPMQATKIFAFSIEDNSVPYNLYLNLRNTSSYQFQNIYIQYDLKDSVNKVLESELKNFQLFHSQTGAPFGDSGIGDIFDHQFILLENFRFPHSGEFQLLFTQMMRRDSLADLVSIGTRVEFAEGQN